MSQLYLVKDKKGRIFGPYTEEEICFHLDEGELKGNELFCNYPTGKWQALSTHPVFYKKIISQLNRSEKTSQTQDSRASLSENITSEEETLEPTRILKVDLKKTSAKKQKVKIKLSREFRDEVLEEEGFDDVIDMESVDSKKKASTQKLFRYGLLAGVGLLLFVLISNPLGEKSEVLKFERLLAPNKRKPEITKKELKERFKRALSHYKNSSVESYIKAQKNYVEILESSPEEISLYPLLCLTHLEIWPFSYQDTKDKQSLQKVVNLIQKKDQSKMYSNFCFAISSYVEKDFKQVIKMTDYLLNHPQRVVSPPFIFYLQAKALKNLNSEKKALSLLDTVISLDPKWIGPRLLKADIFYQNQQYNLAIGEYQKILKAFPNHISALVRLGILEYKYLKQTEKSQATLTKAFSSQSSQKIAPDSLFEAYMILVNIYYDQNEEKNLIKYARKAYALDPNNPDIIQIKNKIKDQKAFKGIKIESRGLIYQGDVLVNKEDCLKAVKKFTEAYKFTRSGLSAFKSGQCYWTLGATGQAIRWLKRAINIDANLLDAHLLLSDYLSQLYQFEYAGDILKSVLRRYPNNPDVYKAYGRLAFRKKFYNQTIAYAGRALNFYPHDIETLVLLSRSHFALEEINIAYSYAKKAVLQNPNDISAQISYALILDHTGEDEDTEAYLRRMIQNNPTIFEYHLALGEYFYDQEEYDQAKKELESLIAKNSKLKKAYIYLGLIYTELGLKNKKYYDEAIKQFREAILLDLSDVKPFFYVGQIHLNNENYGLAYEEFNKIVKVNPNYPLIHYYLGLTILKQRGAGNLDKALKVAQTEAVKSPKHYLPYKLAGDIYKLKSEKSFNNEQDRKKMYDLCAKEYQKALKYVKKSIEISMNLLLCYKGAGHMDLALDLAKNLTKEEGLSGYPEIYREIGNIFEFKEEYERANSYYNTYFQLKPAAEDRVQIERRIATLIEKKKKISEPEEE